MRHSLSRSPQAIADILDELVQMAFDNKKPSFYDLVRAAGLDPRRDFIGAALRDLDFRDEDLRGFDFSDADLSGADFRRAIVTGVMFAGANLTGAIGLNTIIGLYLRCEPHSGAGGKHLQFFFRNASAVPAIDLVSHITISHEGGSKSYSKEKERGEPYTSWSACIQSPFVKACLELAPKVFEAAGPKDFIKLRIGVPLPQVSVDITLNWDSPAGIESGALSQSWTLEPDLNSVSNDRHILDWRIDQVRMQS
jgi:Pentapeptide repeats (8 copies)